MNVKKMGVLIVAIAMILSMVSVPAFAAGEKVSITYENTSFQPISASSIKINDIFYAVIKFTDLTQDELGLGQIELSFNTSVLQLVNSSGNSASFNSATTALIHNIAKYEDWEILDMPNDYAFETVDGGNSASNTTGLVKYNFSSKIKGEETEYFPYPLSPEERASGSVTVMKIRFKAIGVGDANFTFNPSTTFMNYGLLSVTTIYVTPDIEPLSIAVEDQEQAAPTGLTGVAPTSEANNDGKIIGTTDEMEYRYEDQTEYTACGDGETTGLVPGTYYVRYAAKPGFKASPDTEVEVPAFVPITGPAARLPILTDKKAGSIVEVPVTFTDMPLIKSFDFGLTYDNSLLEFVGEVATAEFGEVEVHTDIPGALGVAGLTKAAGVEGNVVVVTLKFKIKPDAATQTTTLILTEAKYGDTDAASNDIPSSNLVNGSIGILEEVDELQLAKDEALDLLDVEFAKYNESDFSEANWIVMVAAYEQGKLDINAAEDVAAVGAALQDAIDAMAAIKAAQELEDYKAEKKADLDAYYASKQPTMNYSTTGQEQLLSALTDGKAAIDAATDAAGVDAAYDEAVANIDAVKTLDEERQEAIDDLEDKLVSNDAIETITIDDILATGASGVNPENLAAYKVALAAQYRLSGGALDINAINTAISAANSAPEQDGDVNGDGKVTSIDASRAKDFWSKIDEPKLTIAQALKADINKDGVIDVLDVTSILARAAKNITPGAVEQ